MTLSRRLIVGLSIVSAMFLALGLLLDWVFPSILADHPITSNILSSIAGFSTSAVAVSILFNRVARADRLKESRRYYEAALRQMEVTLSEIAGKIPREWYQSGKYNDRRHFGGDFRFTIVRGMASHRLNAILNDLLIPSGDDRLGVMMAEGLQWVESPSWPEFDFDTAEDVDPRFPKKIQNVEAVAGITPLLADLLGAKLEGITSLEGYDRYAVEHLLNDRTTSDNVHVVVERLRDFAKVLDLIETSEPTKRLGRIIRTELKKQETERNHRLRKNDRDWRERKGIFRGVPRSTAVEHDSELLPPPH
jgi:hypothetical protein